MSQAMTEPPGPGLQLNAHRVGGVVWCWRARERVLLNIKCWELCGACSCKHKCGRKMQAHETIEQCYFVAIDGETQCNKQLAMSITCPQAAVDLCSAWLHTVEHAHRA
jgi:hypothetical protein